MNIDSTIERSKLDRNASSVVPQNEPKAPQEILTPAKPAERFVSNGHRARLSLPVTAAQSKIIKSHLAKLHENDQQLAGVSVDAARNERKRLVDEYQGKPEDFEKLKEGYMLSQEQRAERNRELRSVLKHDRKRINREASVALAPIVKGLIPKAIAVYDERERSELEFAESIGVEFRPSFSLLCVGSTIARLQQLAGTLEKGEGSVTTLDGVVNI